MEIFLIMVAMSHKHSEHALKNMEIKTKKMKKKKFFKKGNK
jgi:hypothetical protein